MKSRQQPAFNRHAHISYIVGMLIAEIPPDNFVEEARSIYADLGEVLESHLKIHETHEQVGHHRTVPSCASARALS